MVTKALVPHGCVGRRGARISVSKERIKLTGKGIKMREIVVHVNDEAPMWIIGSRLSDGRVVEDSVMPFVEMLMGDDAWGSALGHVGRIGAPNVELTSVAILVDKVEFNEPVPVNIHVDALDVNGVAKSDVAACKEGRTVGLHTHVGTSIHKRGVVGAGDTKALYAGGDPAGDSIS
jgi:hypothetical protein